MALFLSPYIGTGTKADPYRPQGLDVPGASAIDIRLDPTRVDGSGIGWALLWMPSGNPDPIGSVKLADDYGDLLTAQQRSALNTRTGLDFSASTTIQEAIATILLRADTVKWKKLRPIGGFYEAWLGSGSGKRKWVDQPIAMGGGTITDNFNRANETPIGAPWVEHEGASSNVNLSSNAITHSAGPDDCIIYYSFLRGWKPDQTSQAVNNGTDIEWGPGVRIGSSEISGYFNIRGLAAANRGPWKQVSSTWTLIEGNYAAFASNETIKISAVSSTIRCYQNAAEDALSPATDTSLATAGLGAGFYMNITGGTYDDWEGTGIDSGTMFRGA